MERNCKTEGCGNKTRGRGNYCHPCRNSMRRYGLSTIERDTLLENQSNRCLICSETISFDGSTSQYSACVDHSHITGKVRGILCGNCNTWLGYFEKKNLSLDVVRNYMVP
jgi:hypothetical protein